jgi:enoyl-CoA hydratase/carnithine racemase
MTESVRVAREGSTLVITIDRPSVRNAVDMATALSSWPLWRGSTPMAPC